MIWTMELQSPGPAGTRMRVFTQVPGAKPEKLAREELVEGWMVHSAGFSPVAVYHSYITR